MKRKKAIKLSYVLTLLLMLSLLTAGCDVLVEQLQQETDEQIDKLMDQLIQSAKDWVKQASQELWQNIQDSSDEYLQTAQEYLGLETPDLCGTLADGINTDTSPERIKELFQDAYIEAGAGRVIGWPEEPVRMDTSTNRKILYQYFEGGSQVRSVLLLEDGRDHVYLVPGEWLRTYQGLGGFTVGYPSSDIVNYDADFWKLWWQDELQHFTGSQEFVLMKPGDVSQVMGVPALFWQAYTDNDGLQKLGAALSSFPLDEDEAIDVLSSTADFTEVINSWASTPFRMQVFEKGALIYDKSSDTFRLVPRENLSGGETNLAYTVGPILMRERYNVEGDPCLTATMREAGVLATSTAVGDLIVQIAFAPAEAAAMVGGWTAETLGAKLFYELVSLILAGVTDENIILASGEIVAGRVLDSLYGKVIGDTLAGPSTDLTVSVVEAAYENLQDGRLSFSLETTSGDLQMSMNYDPWTHNAWGVVNSQCEVEGDVAFLYIMELKPAGVYVEGTLHYYDLYNDGVEIR